MRKVFLFLIVGLLGVSTINAQTIRKVRGNGKVMDRDRRMLPFDKVEISGDFDVVFLNNPYEKKITLTGDMNLQSLVLTKVENRILKIGYRSPVQIVSQTQPIKVIIPSKEIVEVTNNGSGKAYNLGVVEIQKFAITNNSDGIVDFRVKTDELTVMQNGTGTILLNGTTNTLKVNTEGTGSVDGKELTSFFTQVELNGKGDVYTNTLNGLDGNINNSGNLYYRVTKTLNINENNTGKVIKY